MNQKIDKIIPIGKQEFAYQGENVNTLCVITANVPSEHGQQPYPNSEKKLYNKYSLVIEKFTSNSITVTLKKYRSDSVAQRKENGKAIISDNYQFTTTFSQLANQIFKDVEAMHFIDEECFPKKVEELMKTVYLK